MCTALIDALIRRYLDDAASTDQISDKLRHVCPPLYRDEDALCAKVKQTDLFDVRETVDAVRKSPPDSTRFLLVMYSYNPCYSSLSLWSINFAAAARKMAVCCLSQATIYDYVT